jgi:hypothetical protein
MKFTFTVFIFLFFYQFGLLIIRFTANTFSFLRSKHLSLNQKLIQFGASELDIGFCCHIHWLVEQKQNMLDYKGYAIYHIQTILCH